VFVFFLALSWDFPMKRTMEAQERSLLSRWFTFFVGIHNTTQSHWIRPPHANRKALTRNSLLPTQTINACRGRIIWSKDTALCDTFSRFVGRTFPPLVRMLHACLPPLTQVPSTFVGRRLGCVRAWVSLVGCSHNAK